MSGSVLFTLCRGRTRAIEEAAEAWKKDHADAQFACDVDFLARECVELAGVASAVHSEARRSLFEGRFPNVDATGRALLELLEASVRATASTAECAAEIGRLGYAVEEPQAFAKATADLRRLRQEVADQWPFVDAVLVNESRAAFDRGDYRAAGDVLHELQNGSAAAD
jgi:hypothetical protein